MMRLTSLLAAGILSVGLLAGCGSTPASTPPDETTSYTEPPLPANAELVTETPTPTPTTNTPAPPQPDCDDPTASLRPVADPAQRVGPNIDAIRARGRLIVGLDTGSNLFSFRDPMTGAIVGFDVDIAREIARDLLGDPDLLEYRTLGSAERERALQNNTVDVVTKTMTITCARRQKVDFSTVYFLAHQRVLATMDSGIESLDDLAGKRVCVVDGTTSKDNILAYQPQAQLLTVSSWADCLVVLQQRQVDAISTDDSVLAGLAVQDPYLRVVGPPISDEPYGVGIGKGKDDLTRFVNATLERIRADGTWNAAYDRWLTVLGPSPSPPAPRYQD